MGLNKHIPNIVTLANLGIGCLGIIFIFGNSWGYAAICLGICLILDFLDGFLARLLHASSELGKQLDSFADLVSFGLVPGFWLYVHLGQTYDLGSELWGIELFPLIGLCIPILSTIRLAKFNLSPPSPHFQGLPTPANTILIVSIILISHYYSETSMAPLLSLPFFWVILVGISGFLMLSNFPLLSLKFANASFETNWYRYLLLAICILGLIFFQFVAIPFLVMFYLLLSFSLNLKG